MNSFFSKVFSEPKAEAAKIAEICKNLIFIVAIKMWFANFPIFIATIKIGPKLVSFYQIFIVAIKN